MRVSIDWELLSTMLGFSPLTRDLWTNIMEDMTEEQKSYMVEAYITTYLMNDGQIEIDVEE